MNETVLTWAALGGLTLLGLVLKVLESRALHLDLEFAREFRDKLISYANGRGVDHQAYNWLTFRSIKMQRQMGELGLLSAYRRAASGQTVFGYQVIVNMLPELQQSFVDPMVAFLGRGDQSARTMVDCLTRYMGVVSDQHSQCMGELKNPLLWFRDGVRALLSLPFRLLGWFGLLGDASVRFLVSNGVFSFMTGAVAMIGLLSSIVGLVTDWSQFADLVGSYPVIKMLLARLAG